MKENLTALLKNIKAIEYAVLCNGATAEDIEDALIMCATQAREIEKSREYQTLIKD